MKRRTTVVSLGWLVSALLIAQPAFADRPEKPEDVDKLAVQELVSNNGAVTLEIIGADRGAMFLVHHRPSGKNSVFSHSDLGENAAEFWESDASTLDNDASLVYIGSDPAGNEYYAIMVNGDQEGVLVVSPEGEVEIH